MEQLQDLKTALSIAHDKMLAHSKEVCDKAEAIIARECKTLNVEPIFSLQLRENWRDNSFDVEGRIAFKSDDQKCIAINNGEDFGSYFDIEISADEVKINIGSVGFYSLKHKYMVARDHLIARIWDIHDELTNVVKENADRTVFKELQDASIAYDKAEREIKHVDRKKRLEDAAKLLKSSKYIFYMYDDLRYDRHFNVIGKRRCYREAFEIEKITNNSVIGHYLDHPHQTHRLKLEGILYSLAYNTKVASNEILQDCDL